MRLKNNIFNYFIIISSSAIFIMLLAGGFSVDIIKYKTLFPNLHKLFILLLLAGTSILYIRGTELFVRQNISRKLLLFCLTVFMATLIFQIHLVYFCLVGLVIVICYNFFINKKLQPITWIHILLFAYLAVNLISLLWSNDIDAGIHKINRLLIFIYIPVMFLMFKLDKADIDTILLFFCRFVVIFSVLSFFSWILQSNVEGIRPFDMFVARKFDFGISPFEVVFAWSNYTHPSYIAIGLNFALALAFIFNERKKVTLIELGFLILAIFLLAILTQSRFMFICWLVINISMLLYRLRGKKKAILIYILVVTISGIWVLLFRVDNVRPFMGDEVRIAHYNVAKQAIKETKYFGTGLGGMTTYINSDNPFYAKVKANNLKFNYREGMSQDEIDELLSIGFIGKNPHNQFLGDLMQTGILGLLSVILLVGYLFYMAYTQRNIYLFSFMIIFLLLMMIEMPLDVEGGIFYFVAFISLLIKYSANNEKKEKATIS